MYTMGMGRLCGVRKVPTDPEFLMFSEIENIYFKTVYVYFICINLLECVRFDPIRPDLNWGKKSLIVFTRAFRRLVAENECKLFLEKNRHMTTQGIASREERQNTRYKYQNRIEYISQEKYSEGSEVRINA